MKWSCCSVSYLSSGVTFCMCHDVGEGLFPFICSQSIICIIISKQIGAHSDTDGRKRWWTTEPVHECTTLFLFLASGGHAILTIWLSGPMATDNYNGEHATFISVTHVTNAKTDKGTLDWIMGDYQKCLKLMQLVKYNCLQSMQKLVRTLKMFNSYHV